jgi:hypothetical protein
MLRFLGHFTFSLVAILATRPLVVLMYTHSNAIKEGLGSRENKKGRI